MDVNDLLKMKKSDKVFVIHSSDTIPQAAGALIASHIGALVVLDDNDEAVGMISERDISRAVSSDLDKLCDMRVADLMTRKIITCAPDDDIPKVMILMEANYLRHLPVVEDGALIGMVSMRDIVGLQLFSHQQKLHEEEFDWL